MRPHQFINDAIQRGSERMSNIFGAELICAIGDGNISKFTLGEYSRSPFLVFFVFRAPAVCFCCKNILQQRITTPATDMKKNRTIQ